MNRVIKFRGLRTDGKGLAYGFLYWSEEISYILPFESVAPYQCVQVIPETVGQFTGLTDKNGTEIYEGDIVLILYTDWPSNTDDKISLEDYMDSLSKKGLVVFSENSWSLEMIDRYDDPYLSSIDPGRHGRIKVIGNIHQESEINND